MQGTLSTWGSWLHSGSPSLPQSRPGFSYLLTYSPLSMHMDVEGLRPGRGLQ